MLDGITTAICRPPRAQYSVADLGPPRVRYRGVEYKRKDFSVRNCQGLVVKGSVWELINPCLGDAESCILYLHPNSGSRVDVVKTRIMSIAATAKCTVCGFDFAGCGSSDGDNVSLGVREKEDICAVMSYLLLRGCRKFVLWGRSMGAASATMFFGAYKELLGGAVVALVLDSPFTSMQGLATEYTAASSSRLPLPGPLPGLLLSPALHLLRQSIQAKYGFDIVLISPLASAARISIPCVVLSGSEDKIVPPGLSESIYRALMGPKLRLFFEGGHNSPRPALVFDAVRVILTGALRGLHAAEFLRLSEQVIANSSVAPNNSHSKNRCQTQRKSDQPNSVRRIAQEQEELVAGLLQEKDVGSLTEQDVQMAIGERGKPPASPANTCEERKRDESRSGKQTPPLSSATGVNARRGSGKDKDITSGKDRVPLCRVQLNIGVVAGHDERGGLTSPGESWTDSIGQFLWGAREENREAPPPRGSLGYVRRHLSSDVCPPVAAAWEELLLARVTTMVFDTAIDQVIALMAGLEESSFFSQGSLNNHHDMGDDDEVLMRSMAVAELMSELGLGGVHGSETLGWGRLLGLSLADLQGLSTTTSADGSSPKPMIITETGTSALPTALLSSGGESSGERSIPQ